MAREHNDPRPHLLLQANEGQLISAGLHPLGYNNIPPAIIPRSLSLSLCSQWKVNLILSVCISWKWSHIFPPSFKYHHTSYTWPLMNHCRCRDGSQITYFPFSVGTVHKLRIFPSVSGRFINYVFSLQCRDGSYITYFPFSVGTVHKLRIFPSV